MLGMHDDEKDRLYNVLEALHNGQTQSLPKFIVDSASEGLASLTEKLIKTNFLE
jgi:hypothetical protein